MDITRPNDLVFIIDYGESEAVTLYREIGADMLLIDDRKARSIAERLGVNCTGTLGILLTAKRRGLITELRPIFVDFLRQGRNYSIRLLNQVLAQVGENEIG